MEVSPMPTPRLDPDGDPTMRAVKLPPRLDAALQRRAAAEDRTLSAVLRDALRRYLEDTPAA